jgi:hypothetical protein
MAIRCALALWHAPLRYCENGNIDIGRVKMWRGGVGLAHLFPVLSDAGASNLIGTRNPLFLNPQGRDS